MHIRTLHFGFRVVHSMVIWVVTQKPWFNFFAGKHARLGSPVPKSQVLENFHFQTLPLTPLTLLTRAETS